jgi:hypothetical protein
MQPLPDSSRALRDIGVTGALVMHRHRTLRPPRRWLGLFGYLRRAAAPLVAYAAGRLDENFTDELDHAQQAIDSGAAQTKLEEWIEAAQSVG